MRPRKEALPSLETTGALHEVMATHLQKTAFILSRHRWKEQQRELAASEQPNLARIAELARERTPNWMLRLEMEEGLGKVHLFAKKGNEEVKLLTVELKPVRKNEDETERNEFPIQIKTYAIPTEFKPTIDSLVQVLKKRKTIIGSETDLSKPVLPRETIEEIMRQKNDQITFALERIGNYYESHGILREMRHGVNYPKIDVSYSKVGNRC